jgi:hypothetical protein
MIRYDKVGRTSGAINSSGDLRNWNSWFPDCSDFIVVVVVTQYKRNWIDRFLLKKKRSTFPSWPIRIFWVNFCEQLVCHSWTLNIGHERNFHFSWKSINRSVYVQFFDLHVVSDIELRPKWNESYLANIFLHYHICIDLWCNFTLWIWKHNVIILALREKWHTFRISEWWSIIKISNQELYVNYSILLVMFP